MSKFNCRILVLLFIVLLTMCACKPSASIPGQETSGSIGDPASADIPRFNINELDGRIIFHTIPGIIEDDLPLGDLFMEFQLPYFDGAYHMYLYTLTNEYELTLAVPEDTDVCDCLDYNAMSLDIRNVNTGETLHNPDDSELFVDFWYEAYVDQRDQWEGENTKPKFSGNFVCVLDPDNAGAFIHIDIPDALADQIVYELQNASEQIMVMEYMGSEQEFINMGIEVFLEDMNYEYSVLMWVNDAGTKAIGMGGDYVPVSDKAYDLIVDFVKDEMDWQEGRLPQMQDTASIELVYEGVSIGLVTDSEDIQEITDILGNSTCMVGGSMCPFDAELVFTCSNGSSQSLRLATDACPAIVAGTSTYYDFGKGNAWLGSGLEVKTILLQYFGIDSFE